MHDWTPDAVSRCRACFVRLSNLFLSIAAFVGVQRLLEGSFRNSRTRSVSDVKLVVLIGLVVVWTPMAVLWIRPNTNVSARMLRAAFALAVAISAALLTLRFWSDPHVQPSDLGQVWAGSRALLHGKNPYEVIGPGRPFEWPWPLLYPLTAMLTLMPLAWLPLQWTDPLFVAIGFGLFTWAVTAKRITSPALVGLVSLPALMTLQTSQWSLLLAGAALMPWCGWVLIAKPTIGLALFTAYPRWKTAIGCGLVLIISFIIWPGWIAEWRATFASAPHIVAPILRPGGALVLLALLKWKRPEARLLVALACVPHTTVPYETIPLFLIPQTWRQSWTLWALAGVAYAGQALTGPYSSQLEYWTSGAEWIVAVMYLPCMAMVMSRPNVWPAHDREVTPEVGMARRVDLAVA
jgi:hypothetical protein